METEFTPLTSLLGGMLIGLAAVAMMASVGRIAGISGIISRLIPPNIERSSAMLSIAVIAGLLCALPLFKLFTGTLPQQTMVATPWLLAVAGLLTGVGTALGSGCTSGHGVCGISRLSARSIVATLCFVASGVITVTILRHLIGGA